MAARRIDATDRIPQVVAIASVSSRGTLGLTKAMRGYLRAGDGPLFLLAGSEVLLTACPLPGARPADVDGARLTLPAEIRNCLHLTPGGHLAFVQRGDAVSGPLALKRIDVAKEPGIRAEVVDRESETAITRVITTNPPPEELIPALAEGCRDARLKYDVRDYLAERATLDAWVARRLLGAAIDGDDHLRAQLVDERLSAQDEDGSWRGQVVLTALRLSELGDLGVPADDGCLRRGVQWLLDRPRSDANPGMFFLTDELVAAQAEVLTDRRLGRGGRFRQRRRSEIRLISDHVPTAHDPCGPRIMWPNAIVLDALLRVGYEGHERVQVALSTLQFGGWCECGYQHGPRHARRLNPLSEEGIAAFEAACEREFRHRGFDGAEALLRIDCARYLRVAEGKENGRPTYRLGMDGHIQPCELVTTVALSRVAHHPVRRLAEAYLWRFAARQRADGALDRKHVSQPYYLGAFSRYDHPAARIAILRSIPWIVAAQNPDGSWGEGSARDAATRAVVEALVSVRPYLPGVPMGGVP